MSSCYSIIRGVDQKRDIAVAQSVKASLFAFATLQQDVPQEIIDFIDEQDKVYPKMRVLIIRREDLLRGYLIHFDEGETKDRKAEIADIVKSSFDMYEAEEWLDQDSDSSAPRISSF